MSLIECYRENLSEAQRALEIARSIKDEMKARDLIVWGTTKQKFTGWLVKGKAADLAYSNWHKARCDVEYWGTLLNDAIRAARPIEGDRRLPSEKDDDALTPEQETARKADVNRQFEEWQARQATTEPE